MKLFTKVAIFFTTLLAIVTLSSCNANSDIKTSVNVVARNNKITLQAEFDDATGKIFSDYTPYAYIYDMDGSEVNGQLDSQSFNLDDEATSGNHYVADELVFTDLDEETQYTVRITVTIDSRSYTLFDELVETNDVGTEENPILINNTEEFLDMANDREGFYKLDADLDFTDVEVEPMFTTTSRQFEGGFDGQNHTIKNIELSSNNQYNGLFGVNNGEIKNLKIENITLTTERTSEMNCGLLVGYNTGVIDNCEIVGGTINANSTAYTLTYKQNVGGLVGYVGGSKEGIAVTNSKISNVTINVEARHEANVGGLIGEAGFASSVRRAHKISGNEATTTINVNQQIKAAITDPVNINVGGFIGTSASAISNCVASSNIKVTTQKAESATIDKGLKIYNLNVGGFAGSTYDNVTRQIETVGFFGSIEVEAVPVYTTNVAGLIAELGNYIKVKDSVVKLNGLTISGPTLVEATEEATDGSEDGTTEEPAKEVEYKVTYGEIFAVRSSEEITTEYLEENQITSINQITPTLSGEESYRVSVPTYYVTVDDAFKEKYNTYYDGQSALIASYLE